MIQQQRWIPVAFGTVTMALIAALTYSATLDDPFLIAVIVMLASTTLAMVTLALAAIGVLLQ